MSETPAEPAAVVARRYILAIPSLAAQDGEVMVRVLGLEDPVFLTVPAIIEADEDTEAPNVRLLVMRDVAWGLWALLSDSLMTDPDAIPEWAGHIVDPVGDDGEPLPPDVPHEPF